jgi:CubicO group peptidase (beta-lactamase class C family)
MQKGSIAMRKWAFLAFGLLGCFSLGLSSALQESSPASQAPDLAARVPGARLVAPGDPVRSLAFPRMMRRQDVFGIPPLASHETDPVALAVVRDGIEGLPPDGPAPRSAAPPAIAAGRFDKLTGLLQKHVDRKEVAGAVALVLQRGKPVYSASVGSADIGAGRPMSDDTIFRIASMTKPITSVAVLILAEDGRFKLTDPVSRLLPEFKDLRVLDPKGAGTVPAKREVTIHDLLTQTSGLSYGFLAGDRLGPLYREARVCDGLAPPDGTLAENMHRLAGLPLKYQPGAAWEYGLSTDVLGRLVEVVSRKSLDEFFRERIFGPLGMTDTHFTLPPAKHHRLAALYRPGADKAVEKVGNDPVRVEALTYSADMPLRDKGYFSGGAGLVSTAPEYARFLQMLLNKGELGGKRLLKAETVELMTRNQIGDLKVAIGGHGDKFGYGFGVVSAAGRGTEVASAGTFSWGGIYNTHFWVDPEKEVVGILLTQLYPFDHLSLREDFKRLTYEALAGAPPDPLTAAQIRVSDVTLHGDMNCFKVETPMATYLYGKKGAGFASILDTGGHDWISYHPGDNARGEYRGLPKCGQPTKFFHCGYGYGMYKTDNIFTSRVTVRSANHLRIESETADRKTACAWDFYTTHATLTLRRIDLPTYWFLYEGTPGGKLKADKDFVIRPDGTRTTLDQPWLQVVPWVCFGAPETEAGFVCVNHQEPEEGETDSYVSWPFQKDRDGSFQEMTVFGFGRKGYKELVEHIPDLKRLPARFSIGLIEAADYKTAGAVCEAIRQLPNE